MIVRVTRTSTMEISDVNTVAEAKEVMKRLSEDTVGTGMRFDGHNLTYLSLEDLRVAKVKDPDGDAN
jgi:hypothetical protein